MTVRISRNQAVRLLALMPRKDDSVMVLDSDHLQVHLADREAGQWLPEVVDVSPNTLPLNHMGAAAAFKRALTRQFDGIALVGEEREWQVEKGYDAAHDDEHHLGDILDAAVSIAADVADIHTPSGRGWDSDLAHHVASKYETDDIKRLTIAAALIVAEIERLQRAKLKDESADNAKFIKSVAEQFFEGCGQKQAWKVYVSEAETLVVCEHRSGLAVNFNSSAGHRPSAAGVKGHIMDVMIGNIEGRGEQIDEFYTEIRKVREELAQQKLKTAGCNLDLIEQQLQAVAPVASVESVNQRLFGVLQSWVTYFDSLSQDESDPVVVARMKFHAERLQASRDALASAAVAENQPRASNAPAEGPDPHWQPPLMQKIVSILESLARCTPGRGVDISPMADLLATCAEQSREILKEINRTDSLA